MTNNNYPRDLIGYGKNPPDPKWPGGARVALQFVLNYEAVSYTHLTLPTNTVTCRSRWSPYH